ncbi:NADPH:quinone reductase [Noviherbaspirillum humi]|uniref:NADPH:quinone reductase n=1 Tax=Noviherbaspirillum humi TaxID=1688639 RepID=A0A239K067_9BURK|nr:zinc-binding alcohol dehydrogenase family protein [Noviherbaspirillum humi]SNT11420.1 NADPH:quinone reductase [Noviherbaspirillum humi]
MKSRAIRVTQKSPSLEALEVDLIDVPVPQAKAGEVVVEVKSAGINPSDVKAMLGMMPHATWPRTPGRDYAGVVVQGPSALIGKEVWGTGGDVGIRRNGTHANYLVLPESAVREKPAGITLQAAGAVGVPFVTAYEGFRRSGMPKAGDNVLIFGANGKVGQAAIQLATQAGATVFAVERSSQPYGGHANGKIHLINASTTDVNQYVRDHTGGKGANLVYNTVGSPYFAAANASMAIGATQILIATLDRAIPFDILAFYRGQHTFVGIDTLALDATQCAVLLDQMRPGFEQGTLQAFPVNPENVHTLDDAVTAYKKVMSGSKERVMLEL